MASIQRRAFAFAPLLTLLILGLLLLSVVWGGPIGSARLLLLGILLLLPLSVVVSRWFSKRLISPIVDLVPQADAVARGHLEVSNHGSKSVPVEVEQLAQAIEAINEKQARDFAAMQKLERVRSEFLANVSHELRTPIFAVQGFIETLLDGAIDDPEVNRDFLERARLQAQRLNALLNDLIDISRIESGEMRMSFRLFDIIPFLKDVVEELRPSAAAKETELRLVVPNEQGEEIVAFGDKERLKQVLVNLIENAIKYSAERSLVKIELLVGEPTSDMLLVRVADNGMGISDEDLTRVFERFYRVNKDRSRSSPGGTGLGLAIVKHIVEAHHSKIAVRSRLGEGTTFEFALHRSPFL